MRNPFKKKSSLPVYQEVVTGAIGGVLPRRFSTFPPSLTTPLVVGNIPNSGIAERFAWRPPRAPMLEGNLRYSLHPTLRNAVPFSRGKTPQVDSVTHATDASDSLVRKIMRG